MRSRRSKGPKHAVPPVGNPMYAGLSVEDQRILVLEHLPDIAKIDGDMVKPSEREAAAAALAAEG